MYSRYRDFLDFGDAEAYRKELAKLLWSGTFIMIGYWLGEEWSRLLPALHRSLLLFGPAAVLLFVAALVLLKKRARVSDSSP